MNCYIHIRINLRLIVDLILQNVNESNTNVLQGFEIRIQIRVRISDLDLHMNTNMNILVFNSISSIAIPTIGKNGNGFINDWRLMICLRK